MEAMGNLSQDDKSSRMSMRNSLLVWVFGAVLGWAVAVVAVYTLIRDEGDRVVASTSQKPETGQKPESGLKPESGSAKTIPGDKKAEDLNAIEPAAGGQDAKNQKHKNP